MLLQGPHAFVAAECDQQQPQAATWNYSFIEISASVRLLESTAMLALARKQQAQAYQALPQSVKNRLPATQPSGRTCCHSCSKPSSLWQQMLQCGLV